MVRLESRESGQTGIDDRPVTNQQGVQEEERLIGKVAVSYAVIAI